MTASVHPASFWTALDNKEVRCGLCPHHCVLTVGKKGVCLTRQNVDGALVSLNYCRPVSIGMDPIEKKPLYHFHPGTTIYSAGPNGCTLKCPFCQNSEISQAPFNSRFIEPQQLLAEVRKSGAIGIAYTYSEPYVWHETIMAVAPLIREAGLKNVMISNGYFEEEPLAKLVTLIDAMNIDIKSMRSDFYRRLCKGDLEPVLKSAETVKKHCHLEITNLVIPGENDTEKDFKDLACFIRTHLGKETPLHLSRYFPRYRMKTLPTPESTLLTAWELCKAELDHVYIGNIPSHNKADTICSHCRSVLISRVGYTSRIGRLLQKPREPGGGAVCGGCGNETNIRVN